MQMAMAMRMMMMLSLMKKVSGLMVMEMDGEITKVLAHTNQTITLMTQPEMLEKQS